MEFSFFSFLEGGGGRLKLTTKKDKALGWLRRVVVSIVERSKAAHHREDC